MKEKGLEAIKCPTCGGTGLVVRFLSRHVVREEIRDFGTISKFSKTTCPRCRGTGWIERKVSSK
ncbi:MAG: hypothetical protein P8Y97_06920 [Candidatus Lokiarchaeota archaeon]